MINSNLNDAFATSKYFLLVLSVSCFSCSLTVAQSSHILAQNNQQINEGDWEKEFSENIKRANKLWSQKRTNLKLATTILENATAHDAKQYFGLASQFYLWNLKNNNINVDFEALKSEAKKVIPLLSQGDQKKWKVYIETKNPVLANELYGFWVTNDPFTTTKINERLIEHWSHISYARKNFTKANNTPYGTDDRGTIYVRLGPPDRKLNKRIYITQVADPIGSGLYKFQAGSELEGTIEIWEYFNTDKDNYFFIFGKRDGNGEFGLQKTILDAFEFSNIRLQTDASLAMTNSVWRRFSISLAKYALFEKMAAYHSHFENIYLETVSRLTSNPKQEPSLASTMSRFNSGLRSIGSLDYFETTSQMYIAPNTSTKLISGGEQAGFKNRYEFYRFLSNDGQEEHVFAISSKIDSSYYKSSNDLLVNHSIFLYDENWKLLNRLGATQKSTENSETYTSLYTLNNIIRSSKVFHSSELIAPISNTPPLILSATGKRKAVVPQPLSERSGFLISDIIIGGNQEIDTDERIPIIPSLIRSFKAGTSIMIFFEAYNIPKGGYSFEYHFEKDRWLFGSKRVDSKPSVTILADKVKDSDSQLFSVDLSNLQTGAYELVIKYNLLKNTSETSTITKIIPFEITE